MTNEDFARRIMAMSPMLYRLCYTQLRQQADREDAVQETIRRAWEHREQLRGERYMQTWVVRILLNVCDTQRRKARRMLPVERLPETAAPQGEESPLLTALCALEERYRLPIQLHYIEGYEVAEVARMLRMTQGTVKSRMARGRAKLRDLLEEEVLGE
ncbi:MAG: RNA polymerase sigma factor [Aristaeellaceae bacterium]